MKKNASKLCDPNTERTSRQNALVGLWTQAFSLLTPSKSVRTAPFDQAYIDSGCGRWRAHCLTTAKPHTPRNIYLRQIHLRFQPLTSGVGSALRGRNEQTNPLGISKLQIMSMRSSVLHCAHTKVSKQAGSNKGGSLRLTWRRAPRIVKRRQKSMDYVRWPNKGARWAPRMLEQDQ